MTAPHPLVDSVKVASPCGASWDDMVGGDRVRFCESCKKNVYNLSAMDRDEAEGLLEEMGESICVRFYQRPDGTVMTSDCPVGVRRKRRRLFVLSAVGGTMLAGAAAVASAARAPELEEPRVLMGAAPIPTQVAPPDTASTADPAPIPEHLPLDPPAPTTTTPIQGGLRPPPPKLMGVVRFHQGSRVPSTAAGL
jgi:hypothetical protein